MNAVDMYMEAFKKDAEEIEERAISLIEDDWECTTLEELIEELNNAELVPLKKMADLIGDMDWGLGTKLNDLYWTAAWKVGKALLDKMPDILQRCNDEFLKEVRDCEWDEDEAGTEADEIYDQMCDQVDRLIEMMWGDNADPAEEFENNPFFKPLRDWFDEDRIYKVFRDYFKAA